MFVSTLCHKLKDLVLPDAADILVKDVRLGLGYSAVKLDDEAVGAAFTFRDSFTGGCNAFNGIRPLAGRRASELIDLLGSTDIPETTVGLATANALTNRNRPELYSGDVLDALNLSTDDQVAMVGYFAPLMPRLREKTKQVTIFEIAEREAGPEDILQPAKEAIRYLPDCQVALLTATALLNGTMDRLLEAAANCREVVILGSSTPLYSQLFVDTPVTLLAGMIVNNPQKFLQVVSEGGGTRMFKGLVQKVNLKVRR